MAEHEHPEGLGKHTIRSVASPAAPRPGFGGELASTTVGVLKRPGGFSATLECGKCPGTMFLVRLEGDATTWDAKREVHRWTNVACPSCGTTYTIEYGPELTP